ncbi:MAG: hypothetical protein ACFB22_00020 [Rhodothalassiaceae bacterium]
MKSALLIAYLVALLIGAIVFAAWIILDLGAVEISAHGWIAMSLGVIVSLMLGVGLMMLTYRSHKRGYDDEAHGDERDREG